MDIVNDRTADTLTSRAGLVAVGELIRQLKLPELIDQLLLKAGRNRAYATSELFNTCMLMLHDGASCLDDVRRLRQEPALMQLLGFKQLPSAHTLGNWLRGLGNCAEAERIPVTTRSPNFNYPDLAHCSNLTVDAYVAGLSPALAGWSMGGRWRYMLPSAFN